MSENSSKEKKRYLGLEVRMLSNLMARGLRDHCPVDEDPVTASNGWILGYIADNEDKDVFQRDLEESFKVRRATVSKSVTLMERKGLIAREPVPYDARLKKLVLTDKGRRVNEQKLEQFERFQKIVSHGIPEENLEIFYKVCDKIKKNLAQEDEMYG